MIVILFNLYKLLKKTIKNYYFLTKKNRKIVYTFNFRVK